MTDAQMALDFDRRLAPDTETDEQKFQRHLRDYPQVEIELVRLAREAKKAGRQSLGIRMLWERLRWTMYIERADGENYKLNDHLTKSYSEYLMRKYPDLGGLFETRDRKQTA